MEKDRGVVLASERYGTAECWKYFANDGVIQRRREGGEGEMRGNAIVRVFKVSTARLQSYELCLVWFKNQTCYKCTFQSVFLPQGYPDSVSNDYLQYQFWDTVQVRWIALETVTLDIETLSCSLFFQAFSSSLSGTLATQASLRGVGVGNQEATVAAATMTWLLKGDPSKYTLNVCCTSVARGVCKVLFSPADGTGMCGRILFAWRKG